MYFSCIFSITVSKLFFFYSSFTSCTALLTIGNAQFPLCLRLDIYLLTTVIDDKGT